MSSPESDRELPPALHERAMDNLRFIRETMESASSFTAVPGWGGVAMGVTAFVAAWIASLRPGVDAWMTVWMIEAALAVAIAGATMAAKLRSQRETLLSGPGRKFAFAFAPPILVGAVLTLVLWRSGLREALPGTWLSLYGTAVMAGGAYSVPCVILMGAAFLTMGVGALLVPAAGDILMAAGFGGIHVAFGLWIARRHGG